MEDDEDGAIPTDNATLGDSSHPSPVTDDSFQDTDDVCSASDRSRSHSVESILTAKSFARNVPGLVQSLSDQEKSLIKCITKRILDEVMPTHCLPYLEHSIQLVVPGTVQGNKKRYMVIMTGTRIHPDPVEDGDLEEHAILGINISNINHDKACPNHEEYGCQGDIVVAMVLPVTKGMSIEMDGDGGIRLKTTELMLEYVFKPVNLQALWVSHSYLNADMENARKNNFFLGSRNHHTWTGCYLSKLAPRLEDEDTWEDNSLIEPQIGDYDFLKNKEERKLMERVLVRMREIIMSVDLDNANCLEIRQQLEEEFSCDLKEYKRYLDEQIVKVFVQYAEAPSQIFDYLYLGNEWNASNLTQLKELGVSHVLNVTMEIANFFSHDLTYRTIRVRDEDASDLKKYWDDTYNFIRGAKMKNTKVFVHCRMGVSRSAACVIAYIMKEYRMNLKVAYEYVKNIRSCVKPNHGFEKQLQEYNGILEARHNEMFGKKTLPAMRCPQISEQKLITERWLKEHVVYFSKNHPEELETMQRKGAIDRVGKVSEWMQRNEQGFEMVTTTDRVIAPDLLCQLNKDICGCRTPVLCSHSPASSILGNPASEETSRVHLSREDLTRDHCDSEGTTRDIDRCRKVDMTTDQSEGSSLSNLIHIHISNEESTIGRLSNEELALDQLSNDDLQRNLNEEIRSRQRSNDAVPYEHLSADGPYSPGLEVEHMIATAGLNNYDIDTIVKENVTRKLQSNPSFRRNSVGTRSLVRSRVVKLEVESEQRKLSEERNITWFSTTTKPKRKKVKQLHSWMDVGFHQEKKCKHLNSRRHKICASIKKIIERLLSPRDRPIKESHSVNQEIENVALREGKTYKKSNNRMSMPPLQSEDYEIPKRRCHSQIFSQEMCD